MPPVTCNVGLLGWRETDSGTTLDEHGQGRAYGGIHLHPAPSRDRRDPLNLPFWRKIVILLLMGSFGFISTASSSIVSSALPEMVTAFAEFPEHGPPKGLLTFADLTPLLAVCILWILPSWMAANGYGPGSSSDGGCSKPLVRPAFEQIWAKSHHPHFLAFVDHFLLLVCCSPKFWKPSRC